MGTQIDEPEIESIVLPAGIFLKRGREILFCGLRLVHQSLDLAAQIQARGGVLFRAVRRLVNGPEGFWKVVLSQLR